MNGRFTIVNNDLLVVDSEDHLAASQAHGLVGIGEEVGSRRQNVLHLNGVGVGVARRADTQLTVGVGAKFSQNRERFSGVAQVEPQACAAPNRHLWAGRQGLWVSLRLIAVEKKKKTRKN